MTCARTPPPAARPTRPDRGRHGHRRDGLLVAGPGRGQQTATKAKAAKTSSKASKNIYRKCRLSEREQYPRGGKPTYNLTLKQKRTTCKTAKKVVVAFHKCRSKKSYRCTKKVLRRWKCVGKQDSSIATQFYASFTCRWSVRRVHGSYQQNT